jgi:hypothetical protein
LWTSSSKLAVYELVLFLANWKRTTLKIYSTSFVRTNSKITGKLLV